MVNRVILIGNLGKDPEIRRLENGAVVAKFSMATSEAYRGNDGNWKELTEWHNIVAWRQLAERAESSLKKGSTVYVEGKLTHRKYEAPDGNVRYFTEVVANYFRIINRSTGGSGGAYFPSADDEPGNYSNKSSNTSAPSSSANGSSPKPASTPTPTATVAEDVTDTPDDDLPF